MAFCSLKPVRGPLPPSLGKKDLPIKWPMIPLLPLQMKCGDEQKLEATNNLGVSRRHMMTCLTAGTLSGFLAEPVEARIVKPEIRRKIMEKLEILREKAGVSSNSKPKTENLVKTPLPAPTLSLNSEETLVEATFP